MPDTTEAAIGCPTCAGACRLTTTGIEPSREDVIEDLELAQARWHKARREGRYFRAERWAWRRDVALDHLTPTAISAVYTGRGASESTSLVSSDRRTP